MKNFLKNIRLLSVSEYAKNEKYHKKDRPLNKQAILKQIWEIKQKAGYSRDENILVELADNVRAQMVGKQYVIIVYEEPQKE